jgi:hypothetical protein
LALLGHWAVARPAMMLESAVVWKAAVGAVWPAK